MDFYHFQENIKKHLLDTGLDALKIASIKEVQKEGDFRGNKIADAIWETKTCWRNNYSTTKKRWNIRQIEKSITKMEHVKISKLFNLINDSTVSKFMTKNGWK